PAFTLTVLGPGPSAAPPRSLAVRWTNGGNSTTLPAAGSATQLTAPVPASLIATAGSASIAVVAQGGTSAPAAFGIGAAPPVISSLSPSSANAGGPALTLTAN